MNRVVALFASLVVLLCLCVSSGIVFAVAGSAQVGAIGSPGPKGAPGPAGTVGASGAAGPQGSPGAKGLTGARGASGVAGARGAQGDTGATGAMGSAGATGVDGPRGVRGAAGANGERGPDGEVGADGAPGAVGPAGATGAQGAMGAGGALAASAASNTVTLVIPAGTWRIDAYTTIGTSDQALVRCEFIVTGEPPATVITVEQGPTETQTYTSSHVVTVTAEAAVISVCDADRVDGIKDPTSLIVAIAIAP